MDEGMTEITEVKNNNVVSSLLICTFDEIHASREGLELKYTSLITNIWITNIWITNGI
jgi:hypothetical protein